MQSSTVIKNYRDKYYIEPVQQKNKPYNRKQEKSFLEELKKQVDEDVPTFILTRLGGFLLLLNVVNQIAIAKGWW